jgi:UDP-3-O-[3-hydroxymyristoyl] glucosamine N-acyltransferase
MHETAVSGTADLGADVTIGAHAVVGAGTRIGPGSRGRARRGGPPLPDRRGAYLHPHVTLYDHVSVGARTILHAGVRLGVDGFGYSSSRAGT